MGFSKFRDTPRQLANLQRFLNHFDLSNDGCSGVPDFDFRGCCDEHDFYYRNHCNRGGEPIDKAEADLRLFRCIRERGHPVLAFVYYMGVSLLPFATIAWLRGGRDE